ncbi:Di-copper centre-containing protein [Dichomitus squalens]|uniref:Di-copper centre-containing protein n=1 Tax=Dichomitus squalens TaxID=114155 RepID=A0A4Q9PR44_9APHY|nr:Di-copper centre-containing protein [Dichomitus squalens]TBU45889.1 Di-copper centre-containing protein [Dichomitus squalens]TBU56847.1 Di-copper centre-containing protein [Dichomitus squalens]
MHWIQLASSLTVVLSFFAFRGEAAECTNPAVRKEWRTLSTIEKAAWIAAVKCLASLPHDPNLAPIVNRTISNIPPINNSSSYWDDLVYIHMDLNTRARFQIIHSTGFFFPWHRWYVAAVESAMKSKCGYAGTAPYWNWSLDSADVKNSPLFLDSDPISGLGGWGDPAKDIQVQDGAFRDLQLAYPVPHTLRRNFTLRPYIALADNPTILDPTLEANVSFTPAEVQKMVHWTPGDFPGMQFYMERPEGPHGNVHEILGGDLGGYCPADAYPDCEPQPTFSANEPIFQMHHAMVDKVWYDWQHANPENFWAYHGGSVQNITSLQALSDYPNGMPPYLSLNSKIPADDIFDEVTIYDVMNTTGGYLCYVYE